MDIPPVSQHGDSPPSGFTVSKKKNLHFPKNARAFNIDKRRTWVCLEEWATIFFPMVFHVFSMFHNHAWGFTPPKNVCTPFVMD